MAMKDMYALIQKLNREMHITIVMVTHDIENAVKYSDKILELKKDGYFFGDTKEYFKQKQRKEVSM